MSRRLNRSKGTSAATWFYSRPGFHRQQERVPTVLCECVLCGTRKNVGPGDVEPGNTPVCDKCFGPMVAVAAQR